LDDAPTPLVELSSNEPFVESVSDLTHNSGQLLTTFFATGAEGGPPGILMPGQSGSRTFYAVPLKVQNAQDSPDIHFVITRTYGSGQGAIDWDAFKQTLPRSGLTDAAYETAFLALRSRVGETEADLERILSQDLNLATSPPVAFDDLVSALAIEMSHVLADEGNGISGSVYSPNFALNVGGVRVIAKNLTTDETFSETTYSDGSFIFSHVTPGDYSFEIDDKAALRETGVRATLMPGVVLDNITVPITPSIEVDVSVSDEAGNPLPSAQVWAYEGGLLVAAEQTDQEGQVQLPSLGVGNYRLVARAEGFAESMLGFTAHSSDGQVHLSVAMAIESTLTVRVVRDNGQNVQNYYVLLNSLTGSPPILSETEFRDSKLVVHNLRPDTYSVSIVLPGTEPIDAGQVVVPPGAGIEMPPVVIPSESVATHAVQLLQAAPSTQPPPWWKPYYDRLLTQLGLIVGTAISFPSVEVAWEKYSRATTAMGGPIFANPAALFASWLMARQGFLLETANHTFGDPTAMEYYRLYFDSLGPVDTQTIPRNSPVAAAFEVESTGSAAGSTTKGFAQVFEVVVNAIRTDPYWAQTFDCQALPSRDYSIDELVKLGMDEHYFHVTDEDQGGNPFKLWDYKSSQGVPSSIAGGVGSWGGHGSSLPVQSDVRRLEGTVSVTREAGATRATVRSNWFFTVEDAVDFLPGLAGVVGIPAQVLEVLGMTWDVPFQVNISVDAMTASIPVKTKCSLPPPPPNPCDDPDAYKHYVQDVIAAAGGDGGAGAPACGSFDPNFISGPSSHGLDNWMSPDLALNYMIGFDNDPSRAHAPAQVVRITQQLDPDLDWASFRLGSIDFGDVVISAGAGLTSYETRLDLTKQFGLYVDISAGIDTSTGVVTWELKAVDPATGEVPTNPLVGFLPPNKDGIEGQGFVSYTINPKSTATTGTRIDAQATVVFDQNEPIDTPSIFNTIDADAPASTVAPLPEQSYPGFLVKWSGQDDAGGSGVDQYNVLVSVDNGPFTTWLSGTDLTQATYVQAQAGHSYAFYSQAIDLVGNIEAGAPTAEAETAVIEPKTVSVTDVSVMGSPATGLAIQFGDDLDVQSMIDTGTITSATILSSTVGGPIALTPGAFAYDSTAHQLTVSLDKPLTPGTYELRLDGAAFHGADGAVLRGGASGLVFHVSLFDAAQNIQAGGQDLTVNAAAVPSLVDWNGDGTLDLIVGEKTSENLGKVRIYMNQGTNQAPVYTNFTYAKAADADLTVPASGCLGVFPRVFDWNGDGKNDLVLGLADGTVQLWTNVNTSSAPVFALTRDLDFGPTGAKTPINVGARATVSITDWNDDGRPDMLVGGLDGRVRLYLNEAASGAPDFAAETILQDGGQPLTVASGRASVAVADLDGDGRKDLVLGDTDGELLFYRNIGTDAAPTFNGSASILAGGQPVHIAGSPRTRPFVGDFNGDGVPDLLVGTLDGQLRLYVGHAQTPTSGSTVGAPGDPYVYTFKVGNPLKTTSIVVRASDHPTGSVYGQAVTFTAIVAASAGTATGTVQFVIDGINFGAAQPLSGSVAFVAVTTLGAGRHQVDAIYASGDPTNYQGSRTATPFGFDVAQALLTITAQSGAKTYGQPNPTFTAAYSGFVNGDGPGSLVGTVSFSTPATSRSHVGRYIVTPGGLSSGNYAIIFASGQLEVSPAPLTITANDAAKSFGEAVPALSASYIGFVDGDDPSHLTVPLRLTTHVGALSAAGAYTITADSASSSDYTITFRPGTLTVSPPLSPIDGARRAFVATLYSDLLSRDPEPTGLRYWTRRLAKGSSSKNVALGIWRSKEHKTLQRDHHDTGITLRAAIARATRTARRTLVTESSHPHGPLNVFRSLRFTTAR
jgi:hypothetical protein